MLAVAGQGVFSVGREGGIEFVDLLGEPMPHGLKKWLDRLHSLFPGTGVFRVRHGINPRRFDLSSQHVA